MRFRLLLLVLILGMLGSVQAACNDCILQVTPIENNICQGESAIFEIKTTNVFDKAKVISLSAAGDIALTTDMPDTITVGPYDTKTIRASFTPVEPIMGQHRISVTAGGYGSSDSDDVIFRINDCYENSLELQQGLLALCQDDVGRVDAIISNTGSKTDTYSLAVGNIPKSLKVDFASGRITLAPGASRTVSITVKSVGNNFGEHDLKVSTDSPHESASEALTVDLQNCYNTQVEAPESFITCPDAGTEYTAAVKNNGCVGTTYALTMNGCPGELARDEVYLEAGQTQEVLVDLSGFKGQCSATLTAESDYDTDSATTFVNVKDCYDVDVEVTPSKITACHGEPVSYDVDVSNTGYYTDTYDLELDGFEIELEPSQITLVSGETRTVNFDVFGTWCVTEDEIPFSASASGNSHDIDYGILELLPKGEECADLDVHPAVDPTTVDCDAGSYEFFVQNTGYTKQEVVLSVTGAGGIVLQPDSMKLWPGESREAALYLTGDMPAQESITVIASTQYGDAYMGLDLNLSGPVCRISQPVSPVSDESPTLPIIDNESDSKTNQTKSPTGAAVASDDTGPILISLLVVTAILLTLLLLFMRQGSGSEEAYFPEVEGRLGEEKRLSDIKAAISKTRK
jgi:uncharacterized membrane protein